MKFFESNRPYRREYPKRAWEIKPAAGGMLLSSDYFGSSLCTEWGVNPNEISYGDNSLIREKQNTCRYCFKRFCLYSFGDSEYKRCTFTSFVDPQCYFYEKVTKENPHIVFSDRESLKFIKSKLPLDELTISEEQKRINKQNEKRAHSKRVKRDKLVYKSSTNRKSFVQLKKTDKDFATDLKMLAKYPRSSNGKSRQNKRQIILRRIDAKLKEMPWLFNKKIFTLYKSGKIDAEELLVRGGYLKIVQSKKL